MPTGDSIQDIRERRKQQRENSLDQLEELARSKPTLKRPVFFVPGWTDEACVCWTSGYRKGFVPINDWLASIVPNSELGSYITFTEDESKGCRSFFDFGEILKHRVWDRIGKKTAFDLVGHSMGGLDSVAAIINEDDPLTNVHSLITVATPHQGSELGEIGPIFQDYKPHIAMQCVNLDPDQLPIKTINKLDARKKLLNGVSRLYCLMGTRDQAVMGSARYNKEGLGPQFYTEKVEIVEIEGATHSQQYGITQDPRLILNVVRILLDIELEKPRNNYGYIFRTT